MWLHEIETVGVQGGDVTAGKDMDNGELKC